MGDGSVLRRFWRATRLKVYGLSFLAVVFGLVALSVLFYNKAFTKVVMVTLDADRIGNQLDQNADVKIRGLLVGEVRSVHSTGTGATLKLALTPSDTALIPTNVQARILPKTLFGEKFVDLVIPPEGPQGGHIKAGDVIPQDRSKTAIELGTVFDAAVPLLRAVEPAQLNSTLNAIAGALQGRGNALGDNFVRADTYFKGFNPSLPQLDVDISGLADLADTYNAATPQLLRLFANQSFISRTLVQKQDPFRRVLVGTRGFADTLTRVLTRNEQGFIRLATDSFPTLDTLRTNGQQIPYIFHGLVGLTPRINSALGGQGPYLHIMLSPGPDRGAYKTPEDCPTYPGAQGPNCPGGNKYPPSPVGQPNDGSNPPKQTLGSEAAWSDPQGTLAEQAQIAAAVGPATGQAPQDVPDLADLLFGPLMRGSEVGLS